MSRKVKKNLYLPDWIRDLLDAERDKPGVIAAASIYDFSQRKKREKVKILQAYKARDLEIVYGEDDEDIVSAAEADAAKKKQRPSPPAAKHA